MKTFDTCLDCEVKLKKVSVECRGAKLEALQCPKCQQKIFTEEQTMSAIDTLEEKRIKEEYVKQPIKIGHSIGFTFPKELTDVFNITNLTKLKIHPDVRNSKIENCCGLKNILLLPPSYRCKHSIII